MNIIFCHDGPVYCDEQNRYSSIGFNDKQFEKYQMVFGNFKFITRVDRSKSIYCEGDKLSVDKYPIIEYNNYLTLKGLFSSKKKDNEILEKHISNCDGLIVRLPCFLGDKCIKYAQKYNKPYLVELVGCPWDSLTTHSLSGKILAPFMYFKTKAQIKKAKYVLYVTNEFLQKRYPTNGLSVGCSDVELKKVDSHKINNKKTNSKKIVIGTLGVVNLKYKGHKTVIKAISLLKKQGYNIKYSVVGPGDTGYLKAAAKKYNVEENVDFVGSMAHDDVFNWLDGIDLYIQPSLTEGMPRALIEAMSRGCPCIASDAGGMPELLPRQFIFKKGNAKQLASIIENADKNKLYDQVERNIEFTKNFLPSVIHKKRTDFYKLFKTSTEEN